MSKTFEELEQELQHLRFRQTVFQYLVEHLDDTLLKGEGNPEKVLRTSDRRVVPTEIVEEVSGWLTDEVSKMNDASFEILSSNIQTETKTKIKKTKKKGATK